MTWTVRKSKVKGLWYLWLNNRSRAKVFIEFSPHWIVKREATAYAVLDGIIGVDECPLIDLASIGISQPDLIHAIAKLEKVSINDQLSNSDSRTHTQSNQGMESDVPGRYLRASA